jgi:hypothetical protein
MLPCHTRVHAHMTVMNPLVETELSTVEDKKEEEKQDKFIACSTCGAILQVSPNIKGPEDIFPSSFLAVSLSCLCRRTTEIRMDDLK